MLEEIEAIFLVEIDDDFGVALGAEPMTLRFK